MSNNAYTKFSEGPNQLAKILLIAAIGIIVLGLIVAIIVFATGEGHSDGYSFYNPFSGKTVYREDQYYNYRDRYSLFGFIERYFFEMAYGYIILVGVAVALAYGVISLQMNRCAITVTDRRILGNAGFGKQVDLPLAQITALSVTARHGISVATASGKTKFWMIENRDEVYEKLSIALADVTKGNGGKENGSNADELKKYKELLDSGIITQEEFDGKKKQLLGF